MKEAQITNPAVVLENMSDREFASLYVNAWADRVGRRYDELFGGERDLTTVLGRKTTAEITPEMIRGRVVRDSTANSVVTRPVDATWMKSPKIWDGLDGDTPFTRAWQDVVKRGKVWAKLRMLDRLATMHEYAVLVVGVKDDKKLIEPLEPADRLELAYLRPYGQTAVDNITYNSDESSPRFDMPVMYTISTSARVTEHTQSTKQIQVHYSRVIHVVQNPLDDEQVGLPFLLPIWNDLDDMVKVVGGSSESFWRMAAEDIIVRIAKDFSFPTTADKEAMIDDIEARANRLTNLMMLQGTDEVNVRSGQPVDPSKAFDVLAKRIAGYTAVPMRVLFGSEAGTLASEQDESNWAGTIATRQSTYAEPDILRPFLEFCIKYGIVPAPESGIVNIGELNRFGEWQWPAIERLNDVEEAEVADKRASALSKAIAAAVTAGDAITDDEVRNFGGLPPIEGN